MFDYKMFLFSFCFTPKRFKRGLTFIFEHLICYLYVYVANCVRFVLIACVTFWIGLNMEKNLPFESSENHKFVLRRVSKMMT